MQTTLSIQILSGSLSFRDASKVRNGANVGQSASEVCRLISAGPGGAGDAGKQGRAGIMESEEEPEGNLSSSTLVFPIVEMDHQIPTTHPWWIWTRFRAFVQQEHQIPHQKQNLQKLLKAAFNRLGAKLQELVSVSVCGAAEAATL